MMTIERAGTATVTATDGTFTDTITLTVNRRDLSNVAFEEAWAVFDGTAKTPMIEFDDDGLITLNDLEVWWSTPTSLIDVGMYTLTITATANGNYFGEVEITFTIICNDCEEYPCLCSLVTPTLFSVTVNSNGATGTSLGGSYLPGETVSIFAGIRDGFTFNRWTSSPVSVAFASPTSLTTEFTMPASNVSVTANWDPIPSPT
jgi:uncharacterized repeat protein (TIGR02543 family)